MVCRLLLGFGVPLSGILVSGDTENGERGVTLVWLDVSLNWDTGALQPGLAGLVVHFRSLTLRLKRSWRSLCGVGSPHTPPPGISRGMMEERVDLAVKVSATFRPARRSNSCCGYRDLEFEMAEIRAQLLVDQRKCGSTLSVFQVSSCLIVCWTRNIVTDRGCRVGMQRKISSPYTWFLRGDRSCRASFSGTVASGRLPFRVRGRL